VIDALEAVRLELAELRGRMNAVAGSVADLTLAVRGLRADQARRRASRREHDGRDELLGMLVSQLVGNQVFLATEVLALAAAHPHLQNALTTANAGSGKKLGRLLARLEGCEMEGGLQIVRLGTDRKGILWRVMRL
jgi:hypothetical protein